MWTNVMGRQGWWTHEAETETGPFNSPKSKPEDPMNHKQRLKWIMRDWKAYWEQIKQSGTEGGKENTA